MNVPPSKIARATAIGQRLAEVIAEENCLLAEHRPRELGRCEAQKANLGSAYQEALAELRADPEAIRSAAPGEVDALRSAGAVLNQALDEHRRRLLSARTVSERILRAVTEEVARKREPLRGYNAGATLAAPERHRAGPPPALAFHELV